MATTTTHMVARDDDLPEVTTANTDKDRTWMQDLVVDCTVPSRLDISRHQTSTYTMIKSKTLSNEQGRRTHLHHIRRHHRCEVVLVDWATIWWRS
jgi:hypothetical protein